MCVCVVCVTCLCVTVKSILSDSEVKLYLAGEEIKTLKQSFLPSILLSSGDDDIIYFDMCTVHLQDSDYVILMCYSTISMSDTMIHFQ